jgi:type VI secretion system secreted protein Hcp
MNYSGITGVIQNQASHTDWIEIDSFQWGIGRQISSPTGGSSDREGSVPSVTEIVITKKTDSASPNLYIEWLVGKKLGVTVIFTNTSKPGGLHHKLGLKDAVITGIRPHRGRSGSGEQLTITFSGHDFNGLKNIPVPYTLVRYNPEGDRP